MPVALYGLTPDMDRILTIARRHKLRVLKITPNVCWVNTTANWPARWAMSEAQLRKFEAPFDRRWRHHHHR